MKNLKAKLNAKKRKGFTIVELIVVMAIIAILTLIAVPTFSKFLDQANDTADAGNASILYKTSMAEVINEATKSTPTVTGADDGDNLAVAPKDLGNSIIDAANLPAGKVKVLANNTEAKPTVAGDDATWTVFIPVTEDTGVVDETASIYVLSPSGEYYEDGTLVTN